MKPCEPKPDWITGDAPWRLSDADFEWSRLAVTAEDLQGMRVTEEDCVAMVCSAQDVLAMTDADWLKLRFARSVLIDLRDDLMRRLGVSAQDLAWLTRAIKRGQHGHTWAQTGAD